MRKHKECIANQKYMLVWDKTGKISTFYQHMERYYDTAAAVKRIQSGEATVAHEAE